MKCTTLFRKGAHRWLVFGQDPAKPDNVIDTNQIVICSGDSAMLLDPGGMEIFPAMMGALTQELPTGHIKHLFISHQDPDVSSSLPLWRKVAPPAMKIYAPWMWTGFISHFDTEAQLTAIPDEGMEVSLTPDVRLRIVPAHYLHSPGNYHVYDPQARILFSGDIGAALLPHQPASMFVDNFSQHVQYMDGFHRRWMGSAPARDAWINLVRKLDIEILAPQHGLMFKGDDVKRFLDWFASIEVGSGVASMAG